MPVTLAGNGISTQLKTYMRQQILQILVFILLPFTLFGQLNHADTVRVFYLGGQSNMDGYGYNADLPDSLKGGYDNVWIFHGNAVADNEKGGGLGKWENLKAGHGTGFYADASANHLSDRFGIELSFAKHLQKLYPGEKIALIKYSRSGSSIDSSAARWFGSWEADFKGGQGVNQYDHFLSTIRHASDTRDIDGDGINDYFKPCGIIWMQGESDALDEAVALRYHANLKRLMDLIRAALREDNVPVVIGKISDSGDDKDGKVWDFGELVQYAQEKYAITDKRAAIVRSTQNYKYSDPYHYNSAGYIDLGIRFAEAVYRLNKK